MTPGRTPHAAAAPHPPLLIGPTAAGPAASAEVLVWCPVCGNAPATVEHGGFCSRECRTASLDYHNRREIELDRNMEHGCGYGVGGYVNDTSFDRKYATPWRKRANRA